MQITLLDYKRTKCYFISIKFIYSTGNIFNCLQISMALLDRHGNDVGQWTNGGWVVLFHPHETTENIIPVPWPVVQVCVL